jgi:hypothetical protein
MRTKPIYLMKPLLSFLLLLPAFSFSQNSIIIFRTKNTITIGTDSYQAIQSSNGARQVKNSPDARQNIYKEGKFYFAFTGIVTEKTIKAAMESCREGKTIPAILALFKEKRTKSFADEMFNIKTYQTNYYNHAIVNRYVFSVAFFGIENDTAKAAKAEFYVKDKINGGVSVEINIHKVPGKDNNSPAVVILGQKDAFNSRENFGENMINNPVKEIELLLRKQIDKTPGNVSFPIQLMQIKPDAVVNSKKIYS